MNLQKAKILLEKINALHRSMNMDQGNIASIERDLMLSYVRQLYEACLEDEKTVLASDSGRSAKKTPADQPQSWQPEPEEACAWLRDNLAVRVRADTQAEAAFMEPRAWSEVIRPMLLESQGGALFLSTPFGRNWFWRIFQQGRDPALTDWCSFHFSSWDKPIIPDSELEAVRQTTPERVWREEYLAEFLDDAGQVFRGIHDAATAPENATPQPGHRYIMGVDWGREGDFTVLAVIDANSGQMVALDRFNQIGWNHQQQRLNALANKWDVAVIWAEANSIGSPIIEQLQTEYGLPVRPFQTTYLEVELENDPVVLPKLISRPVPVNALVSWNSERRLALAIEQQEIALLPDEVLLNELRSYALERLPGGGFRYNAPPGMHDDTVIATAIAWYGVQNGGLRVDFA